MFLQKLRDVTGTEKEHALVCSDRFFVVVLVSSGRNILQSLRFPTPDVRRLARVVLLRVGLQEQNRLLSITIPASLRLPVSPCARSPARTRVSSWTAPVCLCRSESLSIPRGRSSGWVAFTSLALQLQALSKNRQGFQEKQSQNPSKRLKFFEVKGQMECVCCLEPLSVTESLSPPTWKGLWSSGVVQSYGVSRHWGTFMTLFLITSAFRFLSRLQDEVTLNPL